MENLVRIWSQLIKLFSFVILHIRYVNYKNIQTDLCLKNKMNKIHLILHPKNRPARKTLRGALTRENQDQGVIVM